MFIRSWPFCPFRESQKFFLSAAIFSAAETVAYEHPAVVVAGKMRSDLTTNVALLGPQEAQRTIIVSSGLHGVELRTGSLIQTHWLRMARSFLRNGEGPSTRFVFVHALNPEGAAKDLRTNGDGVDLNRNFLPNFRTLPLPPPLFDEIEGALAPQKLGQLSRAEGWSRMVRFVLRHGRQAFLETLAVGQYRSPFALYYGGKKPAHAHLTWRTIVARHVRPEPGKQIVHIDLHSGDGPYGKVQVLPSGLLNEANAAALKTLTQNAGLRFGSFPAAAGDIVDFWPCLETRQEDTMALALEIGTSRLGGIDTLDAMIRRHALLMRYNDRHQRAGDIRLTMRRAFNPPSEEWRENVCGQANRFFRQILNAQAPQR